jgi:hypothetical protein
MGEYDYINCIYYGWLEERQCGECKLSRNSSGWFCCNNICTSFRPKPQTDYSNILLKIDAIEKRLNKLEDK